MKCFVILLLAWIFAPNSVFADCGYEICVIQAGIGEEEKSSGSDYVVKVQIAPHTKFSVKIFDPDSKLVFEESTTSDENGYAQLTYHIPSNAKSGYYNVQLASYADVGASHYGLIFTIDVSYDYNESKYLVGSTTLEQENKYNRLEANVPINLEIFTNDRFMENKNIPLELYVFDVEENTIYGNTTYTDSEGKAHHSFTLDQYGQYTLVIYSGNEEIVDHFHRFWISKNPEYVITEKGKDFAVLISPEDPQILVNSVDFNKQEKKLTVYIEPVKIYDILRMEIPYELLGEPYSVFVDGQLQNLDSERLLSGGFYNKETTAALAIPLEDGSTKIEVFGATAIPEFNAVASMVLAISVLPIMLLRKQVTFL